MIRVTYQEEGITQVKLRSIAKNLFTSPWHSPGQFTLKGAQFLRNSGQLFLYRSDVKSKKDTVQILPWTFGKNWT